MIPTYLGAVQQLRDAQMSTKASYRARENIISLLDILGAEAVPGSASNSGAVNSLYKPSSDTGRFVSVLHASEMKGDTIPLSIEVREEIVVHDLMRKESGSGELMDDKLQVASVFVMYTTLWLLHLKCMYVCMYCVPYFVCDAYLYAFPY